MTVFAQQHLLCALGYNPGDCDGIDGPMTATARQAFAKDYGVDATPENLIAAISGSITKKTAVSAGGSGAEQYLQSDGCYHIPRGVDVQLSKNLWAHEIHCQGNGCCRESIISRQMVEMFQLIRDDYGEPIQIAQAGGSGYRCSIHNSEVGGAYASLHMTGNALDLHCRDKSKLLAVVNRLVNDGEVGVYSWGIHVGVWSRGFVNRFTYG